MKTIKNGRKMRFLILLLGIIQLTVANQSNNFENVICGNETLEVFNEEFDEAGKLCIFNKINSTTDFDNIFRKMNSFSFVYEDCKSGRRCERKRNGWDTYKALAFRNSNLIKLSILETNRLNHIKSFEASNVGLHSITRDNFKSLKSLEKLDFSHNDLQNLENMLFKHAPALTSIDLSNNKIDFIHAGTFDESNPKIEEINLSRNKLKSFPGNILDSFVSSKSLKLHLQFNEIETIIEPQINKNFTLDTIDLSNNKLTSFQLPCDNIDILWLNNNKMENFSNYDCSISHLYLYDNNFSELNVTKTFSLFISANIRLKSLTISSISELITFDASDLSADLITLEMLQNATNLQNLDLSGTPIEALKIDTFADMTNLEHLKLKNTGISKIDYGMLSHQKNLQLLDISFNNLDSVDLNVLIGLNKLESLDISGNNLTEIPHVETLNKILPSLKSLGFYSNNFNCTYLAMIIKFLNENDIIFSVPENLTKNANHIGGIACTREENVEKIKLIESSSDETSKKLNEIIQQINSEKTSVESKKVNFQLLKDQMLHIQNETMEIKLKLAQNQNLDSQNFIQTMKNFSLELAKLKSEVDEKFEKTHFMNAVQEAAALRNQKNNESENVKGFTATDLLLTIIITSLLIFGVIFMYVKFKHLLEKYVSGENYKIRARSTNTIDTSIEMPFDNNL